MYKIDAIIVLEAKTYVEDIFNNRLSDDYVFHSRNHTFDVLKNVLVIGEYSQLSLDEINLLKVSALFHDVGYVNVYSGHEFESADISADFFKTHTYHTEYGKKVLDPLKQLTMQRIEKKLKKVEQNKY